MSFLTAIAAKKREKENLVISEYTHLWKERKKNTPEQHLMPSKY